MDQQTTRPTYRLYVDEVGNSDTKASPADDNHRYLSLTGVIFSLKDIAEIVHPQLEALKANFFLSHPDDPVILHRRDMVRQQYPFARLRDPEIKARFDEQWLRSLEAWNYQVITVTIDKFQLLNRYGKWPSDPYHYALQVLLERYVMYLEHLDVRGDVMAEARGHGEDRRLKEAFSRIWDQGTEKVSQVRFQRMLSSKELKLKEKSKNISGLQIADSLAHPSWRYHLSLRLNQKYEANFAKYVVDILIRSKFLRAPGTGEIEGWGLQWLPDA